MGTVPSTPRRGDLWPQETAEYLIGTFVGEKSFPLASEFWQQLLELPLGLDWSTDRVIQACETLGIDQTKPFHGQMYLIQHHFGSVRHLGCCLISPVAHSQDLHLCAQNNCCTRHLAKILIHLAWCLQDCISASSGSSNVCTKAVNAAYISSVFLKYMIEYAKTDSFEDLYLSLDENEATPNGFLKDLLVENFFMTSVLSFIGTVDVSPLTYPLHYELLNLVIIAMSSQLLSRPSPGPQDSHPFTDAAMAQETSLAAVVVRRLLFNYIARTHYPLNSGAYSVLSDGSHSGVLQRVGSAAASFMLLPLHLFVGSTSEASHDLLSNSSLHVLLILIHYRKCITSCESTDQTGDSANADSCTKELMYFSENPYNKSLANAQDVEYIEGNAHNGSLMRVPFASLYDTLGMCLADESATLLLYSLVHGNADFLEYVLVRTDMDTLLMPILETLHNAPTRTSNQIYMLLIILLILSQDSTFNASVHKLMITNVPWYQERRLHNISLGSLLVIILVRTVKYNLSKLRDVYLHTNCLATLANMAPHVHRLSAYASQRLVSLFHMLSRKYSKLAELENDKMLLDKGNSTDGDDNPEDLMMELHIYTDFLRIVLEIINAILTYALPRNPEVVYAIMHRQEVFQPFKSHPRFHELLENIFTVLDFFNSHIDSQEMDGEWSVEKVLQVINTTCRSWRGDGMTMFTQLKFTYEQESHPEEFFIPYVWQLVLSNCGFAFDPVKINLFRVDLPQVSSYTGSEANRQQSDTSADEFLVDA